MKPTLTRQARGLLDKALRAIETMPKTFYMGDFIIHDETVKGKEPYCGTEACIAGHIALAAGFPPIYSVPKALIPKKHRGLFRGRYVPTEDAAVGLLGIDPMEGDKLFYTGNWPGTFSVRYHHAKSPRTAARVAIARVRHWLKTGE